MLVPLGLPPTFVCAVNNATRTWNISRAVFVISEDGQENDVADGTYETARCTSMAQVYLGCAYSWESMSVHHHMLALRGERVLPDDVPRTVNSLGDGGWSETWSIAELTTLSSRKQGCCLPPWILGTCVPRA